MACEFLLLDVALFM